MSVAGRLRYIFIFNVIGVSEQMFYEHLFATAQIERQAAFSPRENQLPESSLNKASKP